MIMVYFSHGHQTLPMKMTGTEALTLGAVGVINLYTHA